MQNIPIYISISIMLVTLLTVFFFYKATNNSKKVLAFTIAWLALQTVVSLTGFYTDTNAIPPRFILLVLPPVLFSIAMLFTVKGRYFLDSLNLKYLTILHAVRVPVELILFALFIYKVVPEIMTFEGRNPDIFSGISALAIFYYIFILKRKSNRALLLWNFICLGLLINIVSIAILSAPFPFQKFAFDQPNIAVFYFPFTWLPGCIVPLVFLSHIASIRQLIVKSAALPVLKQAGQS